MTFDSVFHLSLSFFYLSFSGSSPTQQPLTIHTRYVSSLSRSMYEPSHVFSWNLCQTSVFISVAYGSEAAAGSLAEASPVAGDGAVQSAGWRATTLGPGAGLQPVGATPWSAPDYSQQERPAQALAYSSSAGHAADVYMQTLCPSYTMLTYTHTPLLTNFGVSMGNKC